MSLFDLSHPILDQPGCTFRLDDTTPKFSFSHDARNGVSYINSEVNNLTLDYGTHITFPIAVPQSRSENKIDDLSDRMNIENFIGKVAVIDVSFKTKELLTHFTEKGFLKYSCNDRESIGNFLHSLESIQLKKEDLFPLLKKINFNHEMMGILFYTGLSRYWCYEKHEAWEYVYFYGLDFSPEVCEFLHEKKLKILGVDAFGIGSAVENFTGLEKPFVLSADAQAYIKDKNKYLRSAGSRSRLLNNNIFLYENLNIPDILINQAVHFFGVPMNIRIESGLCTCPVRPFVLTEF